MRGAGGGELMAARRSSGTCARSMVGGSSSKPNRGSGSVSCRRGGAWIGASDIAGAAGGGGKPGPGGGAGGRGAKGTLPPTRGGGGLGGGRPPFAVLRGGGGDPIGGSPGLAGG